MDRKFELANILVEANEAGLKRKYFSKEIFLFITIYKEIILQLALLFSGDNCNITKTEFTTDHDDSVKEVIIYIDFYEQKTFNEFAQFLVDNNHLIPIDLRSKIELLIGFNFGNDNALVVSREGVEIFPYDVFTMYDSDGNLDDEIIVPEADSAIEKLREKLSDMIKI